MMRFTVFATLAAVATAQTTPELSIVYSGNKDISDLDLDINSEGAEAVLDASRNKNLAVTGANSEYTATSAKSIDASGRIIAEGGEGGYDVTLEANKDADIEGGALTYSEALFVEATGDASVDRPAFDYGSGNIYTDDRSFGLGPNEQPLLRATKNTAYTAGATGAGDEGELSQNTDIGATLEGTADFLDGALVLTKAAGATKTRAFDLGEGTTETASDTLSLNNLLGMTIDDGPLAFDATVENVFNKDVEIEDLTALRGWVEATEAPALKLLVLKMLDYTV